MAEENVIAQASVQQGPIAREYDGIWRATNDMCELMGWPYSTQSYSFAEVAAAKKKKAAEMSKEWNIEIPKQDE